MQFISLAQTCTLYMLEGRKVDNTHILDNINCNGNICYSLNVAVNIALATTIIILGNIIVGSVEGVRNGFQKKSYAALNACCYDEKAV